VVFGLSSVSFFIYVILPLVYLFTVCVCVWGGGQGLVTKSRYDSLQEFKKLYAHEHEPCSNLVSAIKV